MAINLIDQIKSYLTPDIIQKAASHVGESESATQTARTIVPTVVAALVNQASTNQRRPAGREHARRRPV